MTLAEVKQTVKAALKGEDFDTDILEKTLNLAKRVYYNSGKGMPEKAVEWFENKITDKLFDKLEDLLREASPKSKYFKNNTGTAPVGNASARKTKLPVAMPSLDKMKPDSKKLPSFLSKGPFVISAKVDGVSLLIQTKGKKLYTRGDGSVGQDISHMWESLRLPKSPKGDYTIRAEMVISKDAFEANRKAFSKKKEAKNARNTMTGLVNSGQASKLLKHADVLCYAVIGKKPSEAFLLIESLGFDTPFWQVMKTLDVEKLDKHLKIVKAGNHEADGLVVSRDVVEHPKQSNPENTVAYKNNDIADKKEFLVKEVLWTPSKHGLYKPVLSLAPQDLDGVTISRCTAFNGKFVHDNNLGPGAKVRLVRSGGVIPHVLEVTKKASKPQMPDDFEWSGADIKLSDADTNETVAIKKIIHFFKYLDVEGLAKGFFQKLHEEGYTSLEDILTITKRQLLGLPGVQEKTATKAYEQIQKVKEATLLEYMGASGCFPATIASTRTGYILDKFPDILDSSPKEMALHVASLPGFSSVTTKDFVAGAAKFKVWLKQLKGIIHIKKQIKTKVKGSSLKNMHVVPTGFRFDAALKKYIEENGGKVENGMSKSTTHVVAKDPGGSSTKLEKARDKGLKILSLEAFKKSIGYS